LLLPQHMQNTTQVFSPEKSKLISIQKSQPENG
jgi:hypothetical protein